MINLMKSNPIKFIHEMDNIGADKVTALFYMA